MSEPPQLGANRAGEETDLTAFLTAGLGPGDAACRNGAQEAPNLAEDDDNSGRGRGRGQADRQQGLTLAIHA